MVPLEHCLSTQSSQKKWVQFSTWTDVGMPRWLFEPYKINALKIPENDLKNALKNALKNLNFLKIFALKIIRPDLPPLLSSNHPHIYGSNVTLEICNRAIPQANGSIRPKMLIILVADPNLRCTDPECWEAESCARNRNRTLASGSRWVFEPNVCTTVAKARAYAQANVLVSFPTQTLSLSLTSILTQTLHKPHRPNPSSCPS